MSAYSTKYINREEAERMVREARVKNRIQDAVSLLTDEQLDDELHEYVYSGKYNDVVGVLYNYIIQDNE